MVKVVILNKNTAGDIPSRLAPHDFNVEDNF